MWEIDRRKASRFMESARGGFPCQPPVRVRQVAAAAAVRGVAQRVFSQGRSSHAPALRGGPMRSGAAKSHMVKGALADQTSFIRFATAGWRTYRETEP